MADQRANTRAEPEAQRDALRDWPVREQIDPTEDKLALPPSVKPPDGFVYERKRYSILGKPDLAHWNRIHRGGWRPVPAKRHPDMSADIDSPNKGWIFQDGLVLCERPKAYSDEARREERARAAMQVGTQLTRIGHSGEGEAPRVTARPNDSKLGLKQTYDLRVDPSLVDSE